MIDQPIRDVIENSPFAERIKLEREKLGMTRQELGRQCGFGVNQIHRYESKAREPSSRALKKLSEGLSGRINRRSAWKDRHQRPQPLRARNSGGLPSGKLAGADPNRRRTTDKIMPVDQISDGSGKP